MWHDKYIGIPFLSNGRDSSGLDCWGLVRLIYEEQYNITLPSFSGDYHIEDDRRIKELIAQYQEGWEQTDTPKEGCVVLFRIFGELTHIGVMVSHHEFIHVREGSNTVLDSIDNVKWKNRITGYYSYNSDRSPVILNCTPHPLKTEKITKIIPEGTNLEQIYQELTDEKLINPQLKRDAIIMVNGMVVPRPLWATTVISSGDTVEYRAVVGKEVIKIVALIAIAYFAPYIVGNVAPGLLVGGATAGYGAAGMAALSLTGQALAVGTIMVGSALINAIAPVRPPSSTDPGSPEQQDLLSSANNPYNPYGAIPVVLGKIRITPPLGAKSFASYSDTDQRTSYLNMLLIWGYGPLTLSSFRIGEVGWDEYQYNSSLPNDGAGGKNGRITLDMKTTPSAELLANFDKIYGMDVDQQFSGIELQGPEWSTTPGGFQVTSIIGGTSVVWDRLTGIIPIVPTDLENDYLSNVF